MENSSKTVVTEDGKKPGSTTKKMFSSDSLFEKIFLLLLTAIITGLLVPYISNTIQSKRSKNERILQAQSKFLDDITTVMLTYETLALDVSWYKQEQNNYDSMMYHNAVKRYTDRVVDLFAQWRIQLARARSLVPAKESDTLQYFFRSVLQKQDVDLTGLYTNIRATSDKWKEMHLLSEGYLAEANDLISEVASDLKITKSDLSQ